MAIPPVTLVTGFLAKFLLTAWVSLHNNIINCNRKIYCRKIQEQEDLNLHPMVLETIALPIELISYFPKSRKDKNLILPFQILLLH